MAHTPHTPSVISEEDDVEMRRDSISILEDLFHVLHVGGSSFARVFRACCIIGAVGVGFPSHYHRPN